MTLKRCLLLLVVYLALVTARPYHALNTGIAWDWGGVELVGEPGIFVCHSSFTPWGVDC
jgi:hypothetical protein